MASSSIKRTRQGTAKHSSLPKYLPSVNREISHQNLTDQLSASEQVGTSHELTWRPDLSAPFPKHLLLFFIPGPLNALPPSRRPCQPTTASKHANFLAHLPYLASDENYTRHTDYVLDSVEDIPANYLIV